ncbi:MAG: hypothetical protein A3F31_01535 [Candidatus Levybacteria bacterium RIFCSPHIGHO2_12_FULL_38_12]|nr:MAG: hypothetical protein A3F31_01535 [Candidatus Levybacteria bacterium RIFCSPHIGHO2_12_FULL_38_12]
MPKKGVLGGRSGGGNRTTLFCCPKRGQALRAKGSCGAERAEQSEAREAMVRVMFAFSYVRGQVAVGLLGGGVKTKVC